MDREIRRLLADDAATLPPTTMDVHTVLRRARRARRRRRIGALTSSAGVLVVLSVVVAGGVLTARQPAPAPAAPTSVATSPAVAAPASFDPLVHTLHVGWMPPGLVDDEIRVTRTQQTFTAAEAGPDGRPVSDSGLVVSVLAAGRTADFGGVLPPSDGSRPTRPVRGRPARCLTQRGAPADCGTLRWRYGQHAYAAVSYRGVQQNRTPGEVEALVRRVAATVSVTGDQPVTAPFRLSGDTARLTPAYSRAEPSRPDRDARQWTVTVGLATSPGANPSVYVRATRRAAPGQRLADDGVNATVDGQPASVLRHGRHRELTVYDRHGVAVSVSTDDAPFGPRRVYADLRIASAPDDPAEWRRPLP